MENSPYVSTNITEDSGLGESSRNESNSNTLYTPTSSICPRKRKIIQDIQKCNTRQLYTVDSLDFSPWIGNTEILSSTLNESVTTGVEKCKIDSFAANYYMERSEIDNVDTPSLKSIKEPTTPVKSGTKRFCNNNNNSSPRLSPLLKLGSPERNGILYPSLQPNSSRFSDSKRCSPAKKCLFTSSLRRDPVAFFYGKDRCMYDVILKIFLQLGDEDLYASSKVCRNWKKAIMVSGNLKRRLQSFINNKIMNKENSYSSPYFILNSNPCFSLGKQSTPLESMATMYDLTNSLTEGQHLERCFSCNKPEAIVEKNISQCTNFRCGAIRCLKCNSISKMGPESFHDNCQQSMLLIEKPSSKRYSLLDSPKRYQNEDGIPTIFIDNSLNTPQSMNSSGYMTDPDISQTQRRSTSFIKRKIDNSQILKASNTKLKTPEKNREKRNSILPVIPSNRKIEEIIEPSSPPKVTHVACTKKSKRMLKRLKW